MPRPYNITQLVLAKVTLHITEQFHLRNVNSTHHMLGENFVTRKLKNILIARDVGTNIRY